MTRSLTKRFVFKDMQGNQKTDSTNHFRGNNYQSEFIITSKQLDTNTLKSYPVIKV